MSNLSMKDLFDDAIAAGTAFAAARAGRPANAEDLAKLSSMKAANIRRIRADDRVPPWWREHLVAQEIALYADKSLASRAEP